MYPNSNQSLFNLRINDNLRTQLRGTAVVAGIAAILALTSATLRVVISFMNKDKSPLESRYENLDPTVRTVNSSGMNIVSAVITIGIALILFYFLNRFASKTKTGLNVNNGEIVNNGLGGLSGYFVTWGVILIIILALFLLFVVALASTNS